MWGFAAIIREGKRVAPEVRLKSAEVAVSKQAVLLVVVVVVLQAVRSSSRAG